jgi:hypothetical protein
MKRGELVAAADANERLGIDAAVADLKQRVNIWIANYNYGMTDSKVREFYGITE